MRNGSRSHAAPATVAGRPSQLPGGERLGQFASGLVIAAVIGGLVWIWQSAQNVRGGTLTIAGAMFTAALARLLLPEQSFRLLSSRRRMLDAAAFGTLGVALLIAGLIVPVPS
jgi:hypothetical protein